MKQKYTSDRLLIREIHESDVDDRFMKWFEDPELMKFYTNSGRNIGKEEILNSIRSGVERGDNYTLLICNKETGVSVGTLRLGPINKVHKISDMAALIGDPTAVDGRGVGTEAIALGNKVAFEEYDMRKLFGGMFVSNVASIKAYTRAGWVVEGVLHGHYSVDGKNHDRVLVGCFNPKYFTPQEVEAATYEDWKL